MELEIQKNAFVEIDKISNIKNHIEKISNLKIDSDKSSGEIEVNISYTDIDNNECFKSIFFNFDLIFDDIIINEIKLIKSDVYVVEASGISIDYQLGVTYDLNKANTLNQIDNEQTVEIDKIKEDISKNYEDKLLDNLNKRDISIIATHNEQSELSFIRLFNENNKYFKIKTLACNNDYELNEISKKYKISIEDLIKGYDKENGKVIFKLEE